MERFEALIEGALKGERGSEVYGWERIRVESVVKEALAEGATLISGRVESDGRIRGPVVLGGVHPGMRVAQEDLFAAVASLIAVENDAEAERLCGENRFALGASIFSHDVEGAEQMAGRLNVGVVTVNDVIVPTADPRVPLGGRKGSGIGVTRGEEGLLEMTVVKVIQRRSGNFYQHMDAPRQSDAGIFTAYLRMRHGRGIWKRVKALTALVKELAQRPGKPERK